MSKSIIWLEELGKGDISIAGGKGSGLGELMKIGILVPNGYVITTSCYDIFLSKTNLNKNIDSIHSNVNYTDEGAVRNAALKIKKLITDKEMPKSLVEKIQESFIELGYSSVAVRSSATVEDSVHDAWAGQLESFLYTNERDLIKNVKECWASLFTPHAILYRYERGLQKQKISVAVVVQKMINSEQSGTAFSVHPVTQDRNQIVIEACNGIGEAIVSGKVTPDSYVVLKEPRHIFNNIVQSSEQVLDDSKILELSELVIKIEKHFGYPCDVEWAYENAKFYIVQCRPITTLSDYAALINSENAVVVRSDDAIKDKVEGFVTQAFVRKHKITIFGDTPSIENVGSGSYFEGELMHSLGRRTDNVHEAFLKVAARSLIWKKEIGVYYKTSVVNSLGYYYVDTRSWNKVHNYFESKDIAFAKQYVSKLTYLRNKTIKEVKKDPSLDFTDKFACMMAYFFIIKSVFEEIYKHSGKDDQKFIDKWRNDDTHFQPLEMYYKEYPEYDQPSKTDWSLVLKDHHLSMYDVNICIEKEFTNDIDRKRSEFESKGIIRGNTAFPGTVRGVVRLVHTGKKASAINDTEIIVTPMTTIDLLPLVRNALALITDEGGITSHAAIVARELKKPCIIGTRIASNVLKDGDFIELDANVGIIKVLL